MATGTFEWLDANESIDFPFKRGEPNKQVVAYVGAPDPDPGFKNVCDNDLERLVVMGASGGRLVVDGYVDLSDCAVSAGSEPMDVVDRAFLQFLRIRIADLPRLFPGPAAGTYFIPASDPTLRVFDVATDSGFPWGCRTDAGAPVRVSGTGFTAVGVRMAMAETPANLPEAPAGTSRFVLSGGDEMLAFPSFAGTLQQALSADEAAGGFLYAYGAADFPEAGAVKVGDEVIEYDGKDEVSKLPFQDSRWKLTIVARGAVPGSYAADTPVDVVEVLDSEPHAASELATELSASAGFEDQIYLADVSAFPDSGTVLVGGELISYSERGVQLGYLTILSRGTAPQAHPAGTGVQQVVPVPDAAMVAEGDFRGERDTRLNGQNNEIEALFTFKPFNGAAGSYPTLLEFTAAAASAQHGYLHDARYSYATAAPARDDAVVLSFTKWGNYLALTWHIRGIREDAAGAITDWRGTTCALVVDYVGLAASANDEGLAEIVHSSNVTGFEFLPGLVRRLPGRVMRLVFPDALDPADDIVVPDLSLPSGDVVLEAGYNISMDTEEDEAIREALAAVRRMQVAPVRSKSTIYFNVQPGSGRGEEPLCAPRGGIVSINGVPADANGNLTLKTVDCYRWERAAEGADAVLAPKLWPEGYMQFDEENQTRTISWLPEEEGTHVIQYRPLRDGGDWITYMGDLDGTGPAPVLRNPEGELPRRWFIQFDASAAHAAWYSNEGWRVVRYKANGVPVLAAGGGPAVPSGALKIINDCKPCCSCEDYVEVYNRIRRAWLAWKRAYETYRGPDNRIRIERSPAYAGSADYTDRAWRVIRNSNGSWSIGTAAVTAGDEADLGALAYETRTTTQSAVPADEGGLLHAKIYGLPTKFDAPLQITLETPVTPFETGDAFYFRNSATAIDPAPVFMPKSGSIERYNDIRRIWEARKRESEGVFVEARILPGYNWRWSVQACVKNNTETTYDVVEFHVLTAVRRLDGTVLRVTTPSGTGYATTPTLGRRPAPVDPAQPSPAPSGLLANPASTPFSVHALTGDKLAPGTSATIDFESICLDPLRRGDDTVYVDFFAMVRLHDITADSASGWLTFPAPIRGFDSEEVPAPNSPNRAATTAALRGPINKS